MRSEIIEHAEFVYESTTNSVAVSVEPFYLAEHSKPLESQYVWAYRIRIENNNNTTIQLISRCWHITDSFGITQEVKGEGVVGEQPFIKPRGDFEYSSFATLKTGSGIMAGYYQMMSEDGEFFEVDIPAFSLDSPEYMRYPN